MDLYNTNMISVNADGIVRYWVRDNRLQASYEIDQCIKDTIKDLRLGPWRPARIAKSASTSVQVTVSDRAVLVPVRINGVIGTMLLATNSGLTSVTPDYARRAGVNLVSESPSTYVRVGDKTVLMPYARTRSLEVGDVLVEALDVAVHQGPANVPQNDGVLGANVLNQFETNFDRWNNRLTLSPLPQSGGSR